MYIKTTLLISTAIDNGAIELFVDKGSYSSIVLLSRNGKTSVMIQMGVNSIPEKVAVDYLIQLEMSDLIECTFPGFFERYRATKKKLEDQE